MNNTYFLLRHGQTTYQLKKEKIIYPWPENEPILLTEEGKKQIGIVAEKLKKEKINLIFSSDITRARQTARIIAQEFKVKVIFDKRLREINVGIFRGKRTKEYHNYFSSPEEILWKTPPQGENLINCQKRIFDFFKEIDKKYKDKKILIISHGDPLWLLEGKIKGLSNEELLKQKFQGKDIKTAEIRKLTCSIGISIT